MTSKSESCSSKMNIVEKLNNFLWKDIKMESTVAGSHRISVDKLYKLRRFFLFYSISVFIVGLTEYKYAFFENLMYLTNWGLFINITYFYLSSRIMKSKEYELKYWKLAHVLFEIGFSIQLVVFGLYWVAVYPTVQRERDLPFFYQSISEHGGMYAVLIIDKIFNNIKFYKRHQLYLLAFIVVYLIYNIILTFIYKPVYPIICWTKPLSFYMASGAIIAAHLHFGFGKLYYDLFKQHRVEASSAQPATSTLTEKSNSKKSE